jgi:hypothetical protein
MKKLKNNWRSHVSTLAGLFVAVVTAWTTIDFTTFNIETDWKKLIIPSLIAIGGWITKINTPVASNEK